MTTITSLQQRIQQLIHDNERLRSVPRAWIPAVHIKCDAKGCTSVVAFDPAPEEARIMTALIDLGWSLGDGHWCARCK